MRHFAYFDVILGVQLGRFLARKTSASTLRKMKIVK
jgi:hypothetical protein